MNISVCIGSSCHLRGSYDIIQRLKELIAEQKLEDKVNLSASFCLGQCTHGCTIRVDEEIVTGVTKDNIDGILPKALAKAEAEGEA